MKRSVCSVGVLIVLLAAPMAAVAGPDAAPSELRQGVSCDQNPSAPAGQATHVCYFDPQHSGKRDFSSRNGRAEYIFTVMGADCESIEILADEDYSAPDSRAVALKRVSVVCES